MKKTPIILFLLILGFTTCKKSESFISNGTITAVLNGENKTFNKDSWGDNRPLYGKYGFTISGNDGNNGTSFTSLYVTVTSTVPITTGTYPAYLEISKIGGSDFTILYWGSGSYFAPTGTITINVKNENHAEGTFSGVLGGGPGGDKTITNGAFSINNITN